MTPAERRRLAALRRQQDALEALLASAESDIVTAWARAWITVQAELQTVVAAIANAEGVSARHILRERKAREALAHISAALHDVIDETGQAVTPQAVKAIALAEADFRGSIHAQLAGPVRAQVEASLVRTDPRQIAAIVARTTEQITALSKPLSAAATASMKRTLVRGVATGENPKAAARRMLRECQGVFNGGRERAVTIARTEMLDAHRKATQAAYRANSDVVTGWRWIAEPDACIVCLIKHGSVHDVDEFGPADHPRGRCSAEPVVAGWDAPLTPGPERFAAMPEERQRALLGPARYDLWRAGVPLDDMIVKAPNAGWRPSWRLRPLDEL